MVPVQTSVFLNVLALHIPDGMLSVPVSLVGWILAVAAVGYALRQTKGQLAERQIPLLGVMAAFIFAAQAINFPVAGGTSGHLLGGVLAAVVLGPWSAVLVMTAVIGLQGLLFQDGGLLVMGWNIVNMGVLTVLIGWLIFQLMQRAMGDNRNSLVAAAAVGAWLSVEGAAVATALELAASGTSPLRVALPAMVAVHLLIGVGEAIISAGALLLITTSRPDLLRVGRESPGQRSSALASMGLIVALMVATLSFATSNNPDGLERVAKDQGFINTALDPVFEILPDYALPFIENDTVSSVLAVILGTLVVFCLAYGAGRLIRHFRQAA